MFKKSKPNQFSEVPEIGAISYDDLHKERITITLRGDELAVLNNILVSALGVDKKHPVIDILIATSPMEVKSVTKKIQLPMLEMSERMGVEY